MTPQQHKTLVRDVMRIEKTLKTKVLRQELRTFLEEVQRIKAVEIHNSCILDVLVRNSSSSLRMEIQ